jgi:predicted nucleotidyltransferase
MENEEIVKEVKNIIRRYLSAPEFKILLFGSNAKRTAQENSDIDIGILGNTKIDPLILFKIEEKIEDIETIKKVDVVDLKSSDEGFVTEVLKYAREL